MKTSTLFFAFFGLFVFSELSAQCGLDPVAGTTTISTPSQIVNSYFPGTGNPLINALTLTMDPIDFRGNSTVLGPGDLILIIQMQGTDINTNNGDTYGDGVAGAPGQGYLPTNLVAGYYEYNTVTSVAGPTVNLGFSLANNYYNRDFGANGIQRYQVIRIPRNYNLDITAGGSVTTPSWNGRTGGVVVLDAANVLTINGTINVSGLGFRGGGGINFTGATAGNTNGIGPLTNTDYRWNSPVTTAANLTGGVKGEGIAGTPVYILNTGSTTITTNTVEGYLGGSMGRGAPATGGGGATDGAPVGAGQNQYNSGGGGGGNAGPGGQGGSGWHGGAGNVNTFPFGGHGGAAFTQRSLQRLIMGGGGGAGTANNSTAANQYQSSGAAGGGIIIVRAGSFAGTGALNANGQLATGPVAGGANTDSGGGGGAGGTIVAVTRTNVTVGLTGVTATVTGGRGGNMETYFDHGPGGGGGGGMIITNGAFASTTVAAGLNGLTRAGTTTNPITNPYGATPGTPGELKTLPNAPLLTNANNAASPCGTLPITIISFTASLNNNNAVQLEWEVSDAINFSHFVVEHSITGTDYFPLGQVNYNSSQTVYDYLHSPVHSLVNYYRLKLVDIDGRTKYTNILMIRPGAPESRLLVYPQPADDQVTINVSAGRNQATAFQLFNASGIKVMERIAHLTRGNNAILFNKLGKLPAGFYVLQATVDGVSLKARIIIAAD